MWGYASINRVRRALGIKLDPTKLSNFAEKSAYCMENRKHSCVETVKTITITRISH